MATQGQVIPPGMEEEEEVVAAGGTLSKLEEADRNHQVATAKQFPRSITTFRARLSEIARANQAVAMEMMYSLPRAGKQLVGPSVRFAEAVLSCWGNSRAGVEVVDVDTKDGVVVAEGRFYDCEQNVGIAIRVRRRNVMTKKDADSYQVTGTAASSVALRNAILRGVPKALWADIFETAKATAAGTVESMDKVRNEMLALYKALGVTEPRVYAALGVQGRADIGSEEVVALKTWHKQLLNKECKIEDIFGSPDDDEIGQLMVVLEFNEAQRRQALHAYKGRSTDLLNYLRGEAEKATKATGTSRAAAPPKGEEAAPAVEKSPAMEFSAGAPEPAEDAAAEKPAQNSSPAPEATPRPAAQPTTRKRGSW